MSSMLDVRLPAPSLAILVRAVSGAGGASRSSGGLRALAEGARAVSSAHVAVIRAPGEGPETLEAVAVAAPQTVAAELEGTVLPAGQLPDGPLDELARAPAATR